MEEEVGIEEITVQPDHPLRGTRDENEQLRLGIGDNYDVLIVSNEGVLLDGRRRLEALRANGVTRVRVRRIDLADAETAGRFLRAEYLAKPTSQLNRMWRLMNMCREYQRLHPESLPRTEIGGPGRGHQETMAESATVSFAEHIATVGQSARTIRGDLQTARGLHPDVFSLLEGSRDANNKSWLRRLSRIDNEQQVAVANRVAVERIDLKQAVAETIWLQQHGPNQTFESPDELSLLPGDFLEVAAGIRDGSVELVLTDVPWAANIRVRFGEMATVIEQKLRPGGTALVMVGQRWVPEMLDALRAASLEYMWLSYYEHPEPQCPPHAAVGSSFGYPILVFAKQGQPRTYNQPRDYFSEIHGPLVKTLHGQRKSIEAFEKMILDYSNPDDLVYDPFLGGGTSAIAAHRTRRRFIGSDIAPGNIELVRRTVAEGKWGCDVTEDDTLVYDQPAKDVDPDWEDFARLLTFGPEGEPIEGERPPADGSSSETTN